jgi:adenylate kinase family enzyme
MGPPAAGKSLIASQLCQHYKLHHLKIADVIQQAIEKLVSQKNRALMFKHNIYLKQLSGVELRNYVGLGPAVR